MPQLKQTSHRAGRVVEQQSGPDGFAAFFPAPLPPDPPLAIDAELQARLDRANQALGRLDGVTLLLPDPEIFLYSYVRKEAVLSSQIEGTQSSLSDLLLFEHDVAPSVPSGDAQEASNYVAATYRGVELLRGGLPLSNRLLKQVHDTLMDGARGGERQPGEFRRSQNWLGGTRPGTARFVPPPWQEAEAAMGKLERFLHGDPVQTPTLVKAALAHAQFETIHPFLDGNGRLGRLLVTLLLIAEGVIDRPLLYLSLYLKQHRDVYYDRLQRVRTEGAWEDWLVFFLDGVTEVAQSTTETTRRLVSLIEADRRRIHALGRGAATAARVHDELTAGVVGRPADVAARIGRSEPPVYQAFARLEELGIAREVTGRRRGRVYVYDSYLSLLNEGTTTPVPASAGPDL
ncbi:Fic family protein [Conexibacter woesei]|uniref:Filamentation induced by cAMP protein Fic n=1 Tax=Conexibacter woesei (strain DSM 14684 / CCUG 47730 / CIP 108061 / JCM 11494 / NBRC 100937 / ID131577) TaxID=469383 RepID=D3FCH0_CONWI|nr:Fic family protein [Conexibacter woesei]ADB49443.1 filamentation induced by cAMP protein Fic [Conexibacter woesei DSM 14684]